MPEKIQITFTPRFDQGFARMVAANRASLDELADALDYFVDEMGFPPEWHDHALTREWAGCREFHLSAARNNLVIYRRRGNAVILLAMGGHEDIFRPAKRKAVKRPSPTIDEMIESAAESGMDDIANMARTVKKWWQRKT